MNNSVTPAQMQEIETFLARIQNARPGYVARLRAALIRDHEKQNADGTTERLALARSANVRRGR